MASPLYQFAASAAASSIHFPPPSSKMIMRTTTTSPPFLQISKKGYRSDHAPSYHTSSSTLQEFQTSSSSRSIVSCTINMTAGESNDPQKLNLDHAMDKARKIWESSPQPVKSFPWTEALNTSFLPLILDLVRVVVKNLYIPVLAISTLMEISAFAKERKMFLITIPLLAGIGVAGIFRSTALELAPSLKERDFPWHLAAIAIFFTLLKLPGPHYPYWGRILILPFANGGLLMTAWHVFFWLKTVRGSSGDSGTTLPQNCANDKQSQAE